jgi:hypothetical protein
MRSWSKRVAYVLFLLVAVEAVGQGLTWLSGAKDSVVEFDRDVGWVWKGRRYQGSLYGNFWLEFNSLGLRGPELDTTRRPELMLLGDSVVMGEEVAYEDTFAARIGAVNAGFRGYSTMQERDLYRRDLARLNPKTLALVLCPNDIMTEAENRRNIATHHREHVWIEKSSLLDHEGYLRLFRFLRYQRTQDARDQSSEDRFYLSQVTRDLSDEEWSAWRQAILDVRASAPDSNFVLVLAPPRSQVAAARAGRTAFPYNERLRAFGAEHGIPVVDLLPDLAAADPAATFYDFVHFNAKGHEIAAAALATKLRTSVARAEPR